MLTLLTACPHCPHARHISWNTRPAACTLSAAYTVLAHLPHLSPPPRTTGPEAGVALETTGRMVGAEVGAGGEGDGERVGEAPAVALPH